MKETYFMRFFSVLYEVVERTSKISFLFIKEGLTFAIYCSNWKENLYLIIFVTKLLKELDFYLKSRTAAISLLLVYSIAWDTKFYF